MMKRFLYIFIFCTLWTNVNSQVTGYMGKKFTLGAENYTCFSLPKYSMRHAKGKEIQIPLNLMNYKNGINFSYQVGRSFSMGLTGRSFQLYENYYSDTTVTKFKDITLSLNWFLGDRLGPIGFNWSLDLGYAKYKLHEDYNFIDTNSITQITMMDENYGILKIGSSINDMIPILDQFYFKYGFTYEVFFDPKIWSEMGRDKLTGDETNLRKATNKTLLFTSIIQFKFGLGVMF